GDLKQMNSEFLRGVSYEKYGTSMLVGIGIPIPILNEGLAKKTAIKDEDILTDVVDYGIQRRDRPIIKQVTYKKLKSGYIELNGKKVICSSLSSISKSRKIAEILRKWILKGNFYINPPAETLPLEKEIKPMKQDSNKKIG
ncbi:MAG: homocysteine biosynthesis protein, partial [Candidatus Thorarchaeota archaeon]